jgi:heme/copper-type cytochrome/quinol oxidase subunit 3
MIEIETGLLLFIFVSTFMFGAFFGIYVINHELIKELHKIKNTK